MDKLILAIVITAIWTAIWFMEKVMPHPSASILVLGVMIAHGLLIWVANFHHRRQMAQRKDLIRQSQYYPFVSVVVPAHNEAFVIEDTVHTLMRLDYPYYDVWVMDDRSQDGTQAVLERLSRQYRYKQRFHYVIRPPEATPGKSAVLNEALTLVQGEVILVIDADGRVEPDFLRETVPYLADPSVGGVQVRKEISNPFYNVLTRCQHYEYMLDAYFQMGRDGIRAAVELRGNGQLVKREALQSVSGWTEDSITDDLDMSTKLHIKGWDIRFLPHVVVREEAITQFLPLLRQRRRWSEGSLKRYLEHGRSVLLSPQISYRAQLDMLAYCLQFIFPIWVMSDCTIQVYQLVFEGWPNHIISSFVAIPIYGLFMGSGLMGAIRYFTKASWLKTLQWSIETAWYMVNIWTPVVLWIVFKILMMPDQGAKNWGKTKRFGEDPQDAELLNPVAKLKKSLSLR